MTKPKALDLAGWRRTQTESDPRGGIRQLTQKTLAARFMMAHETLCRIEKGKIWPSEGMWAEIDATLYLSGVDAASLQRIMAAQLRTWRAYSPDRKGKRP